MTVRWFSRALGIAAFYLIVHLNLQGCSSTQQTDEDLEASNNQGDEATQDKGDAATAEKGDAGDENAADESGTDVASKDDSTSTQDSGDQTNQDLQKIIGNQNSAGATDAAQATADASATQATPAAEATPAAAGVSAGPALPEMNSKMPYIVQAGDTVGKIATKIYGSADRWKEIAELTALSNPNRVYPGDVVYYKLSQETLAFATNYEGLAKTEVTVQKHDTLSGIASGAIGSWANWKILWRHSDGINNPDKLEVGQVVTYINIGSLSASVDSTNANEFANADVDQTSNSSGNFEKLSNMFNNVYNALNLGFCV